MVMIYKIFRESEWAEFIKTGSFGGSLHDKRDGFIHMCAAAQLAGTLAKHFNGDGELVLAAFDGNDMENLKWEVSRGGEDFPHIYGPISHSAVDAYWALVQNKHAIFELPAGLL